MAFRGRQQSLAREADTLLGRTSERRENLRRLALGGAAPGDLNTRKEEDVDRFVEERARRAKERRVREGRTRVVVFGDGSFPAAHRRHQAVPRKSLLRMLADRSVVLLLDEYNTSKLCPCCGEELRDVEGGAKGKKGERGERLRICKSTDRGGKHACDLFRAHPRGLDRDELACCNFARCTIDLVTTQKRTQWLERPRKGPAKR